MLKLKQYHIEVNVLTWTLISFLYCITKHIVNMYRREYPQAYNLDHFEEVKIVKFIVLF